MFNIASLPALQSLGVASGPSLTSRPYLALTLSAVGRHLENDRCQCSCNVFLESKSCSVMSLPASWAIFIACFEGSVVFQAGPKQWLVSRKSFVCTLGAEDAGTHTGYPRLDVLHALSWLHVFGGICDKKTKMGTPK